MKAVILCIIKINLLLVYIGKSLLYVAVLNKCSNHPFIEKVVLIVAERAMKVEVVPAVLYSVIIWHMIVIFPYGYKLLM